MDLQDLAREYARCSYGVTLQKDPSCSLPCSWAAADPSSFLIRGESYLQDHKKVSLSVLVIVCKETDGVNCS